MSIRKVTRIFSEVSCGRIKKEMVRAARGNGEAIAFITSAIRQTVDETKVSADYLEDIFFLRLLTKRSAYQRVPVVREAIDNSLARLKGLHVKQEPET